MRIVPNFPTDHTVRSCPPKGTVTYMSFFKTFGQHPPIAGRCGRLALCFFLFFWPWAATKVLPLLPFLPAMIALFAYLPQPRTLTDVCQVSLIKVADFHELFLVVGKPRVGHNNALLLLPSQTCYFSWLFDLLACVGISI